MVAMREQVDAAADGATRAARELASLQRREIQEQVEDETSKFVQSAQGDISEMITGLQVRLGGVSASPWAEMKRLTIGRGPQAVRIGSVQLPSLPRDGGPIEFPALLRTIGYGNLFFSGQAPLERVGELLQSIVLRVLLQLGPRKLRIILVDPLHYGTDFKYLLRLPSSIIGDQVFHRSQDIATVVAHLTRQMAHRIKDCLNDRFETIEDYNEQGDGLPEAYHLLLYANFDADYLERPTIRRLVGLAKSGQRTGIYLMMTQNVGAPRLSGTWQELLTTGIHLREELVQRQDLPGGPFRSHLRSVVQGSGLPFSSLSSIDGVPEAKVLDKILRSTRRAAAIQEKCRFSRVAPKRMWQGSSEKELRIGIGLCRWGQQALVLGRGTNHHVLIGGKIGSGKSVLLHVLVAGLCLHYAPEELRLYLIDFKQGVEFNAYRTLAHAEAVAIESAREYALAVLLKIVQEMEERGKLFRSAGVRSLSAYRRETGRACPRIVLVVDEFHRLFENSDRLAMRASRCLDHIARESRSFGIHLVFASQSVPLGALESSTMAQFGVRIALPGSVNVLSRDNESGRDLRQVGEAIFNDQGGHPEGNVHCRVAYLSPRNIKAIVEHIGAHAREAYVPHVYEGSRPADIRKNAALRRRRSTDLPVKLFLGEPVAPSIEHLYYELGRRSAANLIVCGQDDGVAMSIMLTACWSYLGLKAHRLMVADLAVSQKGKASRFQVLKRRDSTIRVGRHEVVSRWLTELAKELESRVLMQEGGLRPACSILVVLRGLENARALRGESHRETPELRALRSLLQHGPLLGIHVLASVDTYANLATTLSARMLDYFGARVAVAGGSSARVIDPTMQMAIREHHALFFDQAQSSLQLIRSYGSTAYDWMKKTIMNEERMSCLKSTTTQSASESWPESSTSTARRVGKGS